MENLQIYECISSKKKYIAELRNDSVISSQLKRIMRLKYTLIRQYRNTIQYQHTALMLLLIITSMPLILENLTIHLIAMLNYLILQQ